jgi:hypothetical protein
VKMKTHEWKKRGNVCYRKSSPPWRDEVEKH